MSRQHDEALTILESIAKECPPELFISSLSSLTHLVQVQCKSTSTSPEASEFWKNVVRPMLLIIIASTRTTADQATVLQAALNACVLFSASVMSADPLDVVQCMTTCLDPANPIFTTDEDSTPKSESESGDNSQQSAAADESQWRAGLDFMSEVDVVTSTGDKRSWKTGKVMLVNNDQLSVFFGDGTEQIVQRDADTLQKAHTMVGQSMLPASNGAATAAAGGSQPAASGGNGSIPAGIESKLQWAEQLKAGDVVDAQDSGGRWLSATVTRAGELPGYNVLGVTIGYRVYGNTGRFKDRGGKRFDGISEEGDEVIQLVQRDVVRLERAGMQTKGERHCLIPPGLSYPINDQHDPGLLPPRDDAQSTASPAAPFPPLRDETIFAACSGDEDAQKRVNALLMALDGRLPVHASTSRSADDSDVPERAVEPSDGSFSEPSAAGRAIISASLTCPRERLESSPLLLQVIQAFVDGGGLRSLLLNAVLFATLHGVAWTAAPAHDLLASDDQQKSRDSIPGYLDSLSLLARIWPHLNRHVIKHAGPILSVTFRRLRLCMSDGKLRSFASDHVEELGKLLPRLLWRHETRANAEELVNTAQLDLISGVLEGGLFPPKPLAIRALGEMIQSGVRLEEPEAPPQYASVYGASRQRPSLSRICGQPWLTPVRLNEQLVDRGILSLIFGRGGLPIWRGVDSAKLISERVSATSAGSAPMLAGDIDGVGHAVVDDLRDCEPALVECSEPFLKALAAHSMFRGDTILSVLGAVVRGERRTNVSAVCDLLQSGAAWIDEIALTVISRVLIRLRDQRVTVELVECAFRLARKGGSHTCVEGRNIASLFLLDTLFAYNSEQTSCGRDASDLAGEHLVTLLSSKAFYRFARLFFQKGFKQPLEAGSGLTTGLRLSRRIAGIISETGPGLTAMRDTQWQRRDQIVSEVLETSRAFETIAVYWRRWKQQQEVLLREVPWESRAQATVGLYTYHQHMSDMLDFMGMAYRWSLKRVKMTRLFALFLFDVCIAGAICDEEHQLACQWLVRIVRDHRSGQHKTVDDEVIDSILDERLLVNDSWTLAAVRSNSKGWHAISKRAQLNSAGEIEEGLGEPDRGLDVGADLASHSVDGVAADASSPEPRSTWLPHISQSGFSLLQEFFCASCEIRDLATRVQDTSALAQVLQGGSDIDIIPKAEPEYYSGLASFWQLATHAEHDDVARDSQILIALFYSCALSGDKLPRRDIGRGCIAKCFDILQECAPHGTIRSAASDQVAKRTLQLLRRTIDASNAEAARLGEVSGGHGLLRSHAQMLPGTFVPIAVDTSQLPGHGPDGRRIPASIVLPMRSNSSIGDVRRCLAWTLRLLVPRLNMHVKTIDRSCAHSSNGLEFGGRSADSIDHSSGWLRSGSTACIPLWADSLMLTELGMARREGVELRASIVRAGEPPASAPNGGIPIQYQDGSEISPKLRSISDCIFDCFASPSFEKMDKEGIARMMSAWSSNIVSDSSSEVLKVIGSHAASGKDYLTRVNFHEFIAVHALQSDGRDLREQLRKLGWRVDLVRDGDLLEDPRGVPRETKELIQGGTEPPSETTLHAHRTSMAAAAAERAIRSERAATVQLLSAIVTFNEQHMQLLLQLASSGRYGSASLAWSLLRYLPSHPRLSSKLRETVYGMRFSQRAEGEPDDAPGHQDMPASGAETELASLLRGSGWLDIPQQQDARDRAAVGESQPAEASGSLNPRHAAVATGAPVQHDIFEKAYPEAVSSYAMFALVGLLRGNFESQWGHEATSKSSQSSDEEQVKLGHEDTVLPLPGVAVLPEYDTSIQHNGTCDLAAGLSAMERSMLFRRTASASLLHGFAQKLTTFQQSNSETGSRPSSFYTSLVNHHGGILCHFLDFFLCSTDEVMRQKHRQSLRNDSKYPVDGGEPVIRGDAQPSSGAGGSSDSAAPQDQAVQSQTHKCSQVMHLVRQCQADADIGVLISRMSDARPTHDFAHKLAADAVSACEVLKLGVVSEGVLRMAARVLGGRVTLHDAIFVETAVQLWFSMSLADAMVITVALAPARSELVQSLLKFGGNHATRIRGAWAWALLRASRLSRSMPRDANSERQTTSISDVHVQVQLLTELFPRAFGQLDYVSPEQTAIVCRLLEDLAASSDFDAQSRSHFVAELLQRRTQVLVESIFNLYVQEVEPPSYTDPGFCLLQSTGEAALAGLSEYLEGPMSQRHESASHLYQQAELRFRQSAAMSTSAKDVAKINSLHQLYSSGQSLKSCSPCVDVLMDPSQLDDERVISLLQLLSTVSRCFPSCLDLVLQGTSAVVDGFLRSRLSPTLAVEDVPGFPADELVSRDGIQTAKHAHEYGSRLALAIFELCVVPTVPEGGDLESDPGYDAESHPLPLCKRPRSRQAAFNVLRGLIDRYPTAATEIVCNSIKMRLEHLRKPKDLQYEPSMKARAENGAIGLRNFGNTCYMNSTLQQLFYIEPLRNCILGCGDAAPIVARLDVGGVESEGIADKRAVRILASVQSAFTALLSSDRQDYEPESLCFSYTEADMPVDVKQQKDAHGFLSGLLDALNDGILSFGGGPASPGGKTLIHETCFCEFDKQQTYQEHPEIGNKWSSEETCLLGVQVKGMDSVEQGLDRLLAPEMIEDYRAPELDGKTVTIERRQSIRKLPPFLFLQLQRMTFDFRAGETVKLNHRVTFPQTLNMERYTTEGQLWRQHQTANTIKRRENGVNQSSDLEAVPSSGAGQAHQKFGTPPRSIDMPPHLAALPTMAYELHPKEYYEYELQGIVIHRGTAQSGHYYSFIKDSSDESGWLRLDDSTVASVQLPPSALEQEAFGGGSDVVDPDLANFGITGENNANAYMLVYRRCAQADRELAYDREEAGAAESKTSEEGKASMELSLGSQAAPSLNRQASTRAKLLACPISARQRNAVDNMRFMLDRLVFQHDSLVFVADLVNKIPLTDSHVTRAWATIMHFSVEVLARAKRAETLPLMCASLQNMSRLLKAPRNCVDVLTSWNADPTAPAAAALPQPQSTALAQVLWNGLCNGERRFIRLSLGSLAASLFCTAIVDVDMDLFAAMSEVRRSREDLPGSSPHKGGSWWTCRADQPLRYPQSAAVPAIAIASSRLPSAALPMLCLQTELIQEVLPLGIKKWFKFDEMMRVLATGASVSRSFRAALLWSGAFCQLGDIGLQARSPLPGALRSSDSSPVSRYVIGNSAVAPTCSGLLATVFQVANDTHIPDVPSTWSHSGVQSLLKHSTASIDPSTVYQRAFVGLESPLSKSLIITASQAGDAGISLSDCRVGSRTVTEHKDGSCSNDESNTDKAISTCLLAAPVANCPAEHGGSHDDLLTSDSASSALLGSIALVAESMRSGHAFVSGSQFFERIIQQNPTVLPSAVTEVCAGLNSGDARVRVRAWILVGTLFRAVDRVDGHLMAMAQQREEDQADAIADGLTSSCTPPNVCSTYATTAWTVFEPMAVRQITPLHQWLVCSLLGGQRGSLPLPEAGADTATIPFSVIPVPDGSISGILGSAFSRRKIKGTSRVITDLLFAYLKLTQFSPAASIVALRGLQASPPTELAAFPDRWLDWPRRTCVQLSLKMHDISRPAEPSEVAVLQRYLDLLSVSIYGITPAPISLERCEKIIDEFFANSSNQRIAFRVKIVDDPIDDRGPVIQWVVINQYHRRVQMDFWFLPETLFAFPEEALNYRTIEGRRSEVIEAGQVCIIYESPLIDPASTCQAEQDKWSYEWRAL